VVYVSEYTAIIIFRHVLKKPPLWLVLHVEKLASSVGWDVDFVCEGLWVSMEGGLLVKVGKLLVSFEKQVYFVFCSGFALYHALMGLFVLLLDHLHYLGHGVLSCVIIYVGGLDACAFYMRLEDL